MKKELQKIINWTKDEQEKADARMRIFDRRQMYTEAACMFDRKHAFSEMEQKLTLLLNSESDHSGKNDADNSGKPM